MGFSVLAAALSSVCSAAGSSAGAVSSAAAFLSPSPDGAEDLSPVSVRIADSAAAFASRRRCDSRSLTFSSSTAIDIGDASVIASLRLITRLRSTASLKRNALVISVRTS